MTPVRIRKLVKRFGDVFAVDDVSLTIEGGELFFLLGPSGCGKTTLLRIIAGFVEPDGGTIALGGQRHRRTCPPNQRDTAMVFQNYALWPHMTVGRERRLRAGGARASAGKQRRERIHEALSLGADGEARGRKPERALRRAAAAGGAGAGAGRPARSACCWTSRSPTSTRSCGCTCGGEIRQALQAAPPCTTVYVTHDQKEALSMADRIAVMNDGTHRAGRHAGGGLQPAGQPVRGGVPRRDQLHRGRGDRAEGRVLGGAVGGGGDPDRWRRRDRGGDAGGGLGPAGIDPDQLRPGRDRRR